jgi:hypothetical protein
MVVLQAGCKALRRVPGAGSIQLRQVLHWVDDAALVTHFEV